MRSVQPVVGYHRDVVVGCYRFEYRNGESEAMLVFCIALTKHERVVEKNDFTVHIFDND